jgi:hypothetical protein
MRPDTMLRRPNRPRAMRSRNESAISPSVGVMAAAVGPTYDIA